MVVFCLGVSDRLVDPFLCFPLFEVRLGLKLFSWRHSTAGIFITFMPSVGRFREVGVPVCLGSFSLSFYFQGFLSLEGFFFSLCPPGHLFVLTEGVFSPGFLGFYFPFSPGLFWIPLFLDGCVPLFLLGCVHLSRIFLLQGERVFSPFFPLLRKLFRFRA